MPRGGRPAGTGVDDVSDRESRIPRILFVLSLAGLVFAYGVAVGAYRLFPFDILDYVVDSAQAVFADREMLTGSEPTEFLQPARHEGEGVTRWDREQASPGRTLVSGFFDDGNEIRLLEMDGTVVNRWPLRFSEIWTSTDHVDPPSRVPTTDWHVDVEGIMLFPDGSIAFNFAGLGLTKMDRCGVVEWQLPRMTHHSLEPSRAGGLWVPAAEYVDTTDVNAFQPLVPPYLDHTILELGPDGTVLREISLLDVFFSNDLQALLFANGSQRVAPPQEDPLHLNDIEELPDSLADDFPMFDAGDLLLSMRDLNLVMVLDPDDGEVKWHRTGPWIRQHDPDWGHGTITVYNNNTDDAGGAIFGGSNIIQVDPASGQVPVIYGNEPGEAFYSQVRGKHQWLPNGNLLVTEHGAGRFFEVSAEGRLVWEFVNRYDADRIANVTQAVRYPLGYEHVETWSCP